LRSGAGIAASSADAEPVAEFATAEPDWVGADVEPALVELSVVEPAGAAEVVLGDADECPPPRVAATATPTPAATTTSAATAPMTSRLRPPEPVATPGIATGS
jgi:hypothetical protein